jgi:hypothetical protein
MRERAGVAQLIVPTSKFQMIDVGLFFAHNPGPS